MTGDSLPSIAIWICHSGSQPQSDYYSQQGFGRLALIQARLLEPTFSTHRLILSMASLSRRGLITFHKSILESMLCPLLPSLLIDRGNTVIFRSTSLHCYWMFLFADAWIRKRRQAPNCILLKVRAVFILTFLSDTLEQESNRCWRRGRSWICLVCLKIILCVS